MIVQVGRLIFSPCTKLPTTEYRPTEYRPRLPKRLIMPNSRQLQHRGITRTIPINYDLLVVGEVEVLTDAVDLFFAVAIFSSNFPGQATIYDFHFRRNYLQALLRRPGRDPILR